MTSRRHPTNMLSFWQNYIDIVDGGLRNHYCNKEYYNLWQLQKFPPISWTLLTLQSTSWTNYETQSSSIIQTIESTNYNLTKCKQLSIKKVRNGPCWVIMLSKWYNVRAIFSTRAWTLDIVCVKQQCDIGLSISLLAILWNQQARFVQI